MTDAQALQKIENLYQQNKKQEALTEYNALMQNAGDRFDLWINYASFLHRCGQYPEAVAIAQKSIALKPTCEGYHNLGCALVGMGKTQEAIAALKTALHFNYNYAESHLGLARLYDRNGLPLLAIDHLQTAITFLPPRFENWMLLAQSRMNAGRTREALSALRTARTLNDKSEALWPLYGKLFATLNDFDINQTLIDELTSAMFHPHVDPENLRNVTVSVFFQQAVVIALSNAMETDYRISGFETLLNDKNLNWPVLNIELFIGMLTQFTAINEKTEKLFTSIRYHALCGLNDAAITSKITKLLPFFSGLACQCFLVEYVNFESQEETKIISELEDKITASLNQTSALEIALYGCYRPLHKLKNASEIANKYASEPAIKILLRIQIEEPFEEEKIKATLPTLTTIDDSISLLVKAQYETNPYPRWNKTPITQLREFKSVLRYLFPYLDDHAFKNINLENISTLIPGCGTGRQPIETAMMYKNTDITAIDISASSLAYAVRKTKEFKIGNIRYGIADILKIRELNKTFDVIFCGGVLHHMQDPMAGWRALNDCLKPGGFMLIALYSEIARKSVVHARSLIQERGYSDDIQGLRTCREDIKLFSDHHPVKHLTKWSDFYTASMFRDLAFHVQEHRFTPRQLKKCIEELNLEFLGFQFRDPSILKEYTALYPDDPYARNLEYWDDFERQHPDLFYTMYHLWLRKPD